MINLQSHIYQSTNRLDSETCKEIIKQFEEHPWLQVKGKTGKDNKVTDEKVSTDIVCDQTCIDSELMGPPLKKMLKFLGGELEHYKKQYKFLENVPRWGVREKFNIQRYQPGEGYFAWHSEYRPDGLEVSKRLIVWTVYLNDVKNAGTEFSEYGAVDAEEGKCILWPAYWTHFHRGIISDTETKYIATGWYSFLD